MGAEKKDFPEDFLIDVKADDVMSSAPFDMGPAVKVSPLIKTARWGLLLAGVVYGYKRYNVLKAREDEIAAYEARMKPIWDAEKAAAKAKEGREQLIILAKETGTKFQTTFKESFPGERCRFKKKNNFSEASFFNKHQEFRQPRHL